MIILLLVFLAFVIERFVQVIKPLWKGAAIGGLPVSSLVGISIGIAICVLMRLSLADADPRLSGLIVSEPAKYIMYVITGGGVGAGSSVFHDWWTKWNSYPKT